MIVIKIPKDNFLLTELFKAAGTILLILALQGITYRLGKIKSISMQIIEAMGRPKMHICLLVS